jgi:hypothetical protein
MWMQVLCASLLLPPSTRICHSSTLSKHHYFDSFSSLPAPHFFVTTIMESSTPNIFISMKAECNGLYFSVDKV